MLAMVVNENVGSLDTGGVLACIASMLAPTGGARKNPRKPSIPCLCKSWKASCSSPAAPASGVKSLL